MTSILSRNAAFTAHTKPTTGDIKSSFVSVDHLGWLRCNGRALSTVTYNLLFQVIGYTYGRSGNDFRLPNMEGRVIGSEGTINEPSGTHPFPSGTVTGEVEHKLLVAEMPAHNHDIRNPVVNPPANGVTTTNGAHTHTSNAEGPTQSGGGTATANGYGLVYQNGQSTSNAIPIDPSNEPNLLTTSIALQIISAGAHEHEIKPNGNDDYHNNMQPTIFYGNTFVYCGIPTTTNLVQTNPNWETSWPYPVPQSNPPLL
jgi:microcystin-dependent protein